MYLIQPAYLLSLANRAWESVQKESVLALGLIQIAVDHVHHQVVGHQLASVHYTLQFGANLRAGRNFGAQHITGGQMAHAELLLEQRRLQNMQNNKHQNKLYHIICLHNPRRERANNYLIILVGSKSHTHTHTHTSYMRISKVDFVE